MKNLRTSVLCACIALTSLGAFAQGTTDPVPVNEPDYNKPKLFANLPDQVQLNTDDLASLFSNPVGSPAGIRLSDDARLRFEGVVVSSGSKYNNSIVSVVIRSSNFSGANLTISRVTLDDGATVYRGRILSLHNGDLYELQQREGRYYFVKRNFYDLVNE